jgi:hypothetical protein
LATVDVAAEGDGACVRATRKERREFDALGVVPGDPNGRACVQVGGAHVDVDSRGDAQPPAPLDAGLCLEVLAVGPLDGCRGEHRLTEESAATGSNAAEALAAVNHPREAQVVTRPPGRHGWRRAQARAGTRLSRSLVRSAR